LTLVGRIGLREHRGPGIHVFPRGGPPPDIEDLKLVEELNTFEAPYIQNRGLFNMKNKNVLFGVVCVLLAFSFARTPARTSEAPGYPKRWKDVPTLQQPSGDRITDTIPQLPDPLHPDYSTAPVQPWEKPFTNFRFRVFQEDGHTLPYRLYSPPVIEPGKKYPLVIFFHGAGERGVDNRYQFFRFAPVAFWEKYPCYIIAPQCPPKPPGGPDGESTWVQTSFGAPAHTMKADPSWPMRLAMKAIAKTIAGNDIDSDRIYVTGLSMGGFATWEILQREPGLFAAAMPVCGGADTAYAPLLKGIPIWVFHGSADNTVMPKRSRDMVSALERAGGHPKYTEFPGVGHGAWSKTYPDPAVWDWLFAQRRK
jgi:predicted esterase